MKLSLAILSVSILSGIENFEGVYISVVTPNQLADNVGLKVYFRITDDIQFKENKAKL